MKRMKDSLAFTLLNLIMAAQAQSTSHTLCLQNIET